MKIRNKILLYFSATTILLVGIMFLIIYWLFSEFREEDFQQRQKDKILSTLHFISEVEKDKKELIEAVNRLTINSLLNEKLLIFDSSKNLIYSSLDDVPIGYSNEWLNELNEKNQWKEQMDGVYDVVAIYFKSNDKSYYGISKAYDEFGYTKLSFLRNLLIIVFIIFTALVVLLSVYIANRIAQPISMLSTLLGKYRLGESVAGESIQTNTFEIDFLNAKFNELVNRTNEAYVFQKNSIHHISHQLKTPIAVLISELERIKQRTGDNAVQNDIDRQIAKTKSLADVITVLLEISKIESGQNVAKQPVRIDEIVFDCIEELNMLYPGFVFEVHYIPDAPDASKLVVNANEMLLQEAFKNLLGNCIAYSSEAKAEITIDCTGSQQLKISIVNQGRSVAPEEKKYLFSHFFRGENSRGKVGFGLGLVLTKNIIELHRGTIVYANPQENINAFIIQLPLL
ncbi:MAG: sensor histidine kinase [Agriterribacter sp.]